MALQQLLHQEGVGMTCRWLNHSTSICLITTGITVFRIPSFVGKMKEAIDTVILGHLTFVILIGVHLMNGQAEGPTPLINLALNLLFIILYFSKRNKG